MILIRKMIVGCQFIRSNDYTYNFFNCDKCGMEFAKPYDKAYYSKKHNDYEVFPFDFKYCPICGNKLVDD